MRNQVVPKLLAAGVPVVLGSDYSPSMIPTPFDLIHAALAANCEAGSTDHALVPEDAVAMATNAGTVMGQPGQLGEVKVGQLADLVVLDTCSPHHFGSRHPVPSIALRGRSSDIRTVIVDGQVVVDQGSVTTVDVEQVQAAAEAMLRSFSE